MDRAEEEPLDPRAAMQLLGDTDRQVRQRLDTDGRILYGAWGIAWLVGYGAVWWSTRGQDPYTGPGGASLGLMAVLMAGALAITIVTVHRATRGVGGAAGTSGLMWGLSWPLAFIGLYAVMGSVIRAGAGPEVIGLLSGGGSALVVGIIYLGGAALWRDWAFFGLGCWIILVVAAAVLTGPHTYPLVMALAGGLGFLAAAVWSAVQRRR